MIDSHVSLEDSVWELPEDRAQQLYRISKEDIVKPWKYIKNLFIKTPVSQWRSDLKEWEEAILSNKASFSTNSTKFKDLQKSLGSLIEIADLIDYIPEVDIFE